MIETMNRPQGIRQTQEAHQHAEGAVAMTLENQTARLPSDVWLWSSLGCMGVSLCLQLKGKQHESLFVGQWVAPFLLIGIYNKLVKIGGSDRIHQ